jgi:hypothetical protein
MSTLFLEFQKKKRTHFVEEGVLEKKSYRKFKATRDIPKNGPRVKNFKKKLTHFVEEGVLDYVLGGGRPAVSN